MTMGLVWMRGRETMWPLQNLTLLWAQQHLTLMKLKEVQRWMVGHR